MLDKEIEKLDVQDLQSLVDNGVCELKTLEYKQTLLVNSESQKKEFLADVSSFANASGGHLIFGVPQDPETGKPLPMQGLEIENPDQEILRLESIIRDGIEPHIPSIATKAVELADSRTVLVIRIPKSWIGPHRIRYQHYDRFYSRSSNGKYPLDVSELRLAFNLSETLAERIRSFRRDRVARILADETPVALGRGAKIALHLVPAVSFNPGRSYEIGKIALNPWATMPPMRSSGSNYRYNFDGLLTYSGATQEKSDSYVQLFRNGIIEAVEGRLLAYYEGQRRIPSAVFEKELIISFGKYFTVAKTLNVELPIFVFLDLLEVKGYCMPENRYYDGQVHTIDRDLLLLPEVVVESYDVKPHAVLRLCFDSIWNACGVERSPYYDEAGEWVGVR